MNKTIAPFARHLYVMLKPVGSICNLDCSYCYYLEKENLYANTAKHFMSEELLERFIKDYLRSQTKAEVLFTWHGGEALMRPIKFYQKALDLQKKYGGGRPIDNSIQTNGVLLTDEWCEFFKRNNFLVGISIDGPREFHDKHRRSKQGHSTFDQVMRGVELLKKHQVEFNAMAVINSDNVKHPLEVYNFFKEIGCQFIQFSPIVERISSNDNGLKFSSPTESGIAEVAPYTVDPDEFANFYLKIFDEWVRKDVGSIYIQLFDSTLANWVGQPPGVCTLAKTCGHAGVMEFNGDVYSCDHFVYPEFKIGNIYSQNLTSMMYSDKQQRFGSNKFTSLPRQCRECRYLFACYGECPKNRFITDKYGEPGLNYLCNGFYKFFDHVRPYMDYMKEEYENQRPPANVMSWVNRGMK
ncbi:anaerobic sulfatase-maturation protein [Acetobacteroides hydrogenigenes]|uniref:Radical SAM core domain-containing protein n=1 Tax=Acetobacteroides hydrogenigenes TaxID=979970 RepID=A0A4R2ECH2_9BACT|nr:anaerobic sulfatase-maturation protein [Acetobacteroides hydrogenigenes]TCN65665.1 uncharacterized protein CLV25_11054 [Acetobacteroides hydrogenigenes]